MPASLLEANSELVTSFKAYDDMLESRALNEATRNSESLHHRHTRQVGSVKRKYWARIWCVDSYDDDY